MRSRVDVTLEDETQRYFLPLSARWGDENLRPGAPKLSYTLAKIRRGPKVGALIDGAFDERLAAACSRRCGRPGARTAAGTVRFHATDASRRSPSSATPRPLGVEQSNVSIAFGDKVILKVYRRLRPASSPTSRWRASSPRSPATPHTPAYYGSVDHSRRRPDDARRRLRLRAEPGRCLVAVVEGLERDLDALRLRSAAAAPQPEDDGFPFPLGIGALLGQRTAELHRAFATDRRPGLHVEPLTAGHLECWAAEAADEAAAVVDRLAGARRPAPARARRWRRAAGRGAADAARPHRAAWRDGALGRPLSRIHGDYHLGQVLIAQSDVAIIDFEGEPGASPGRAPPRSPRRCATWPACCARSTTRPRWRSTGTASAATRRATRSPPGRCAGATRPWRPSWPPTASMVRGPRPCPATLQGGDGRPVQVNAFLPQAAQVFVTEGGRDVAELDRIDPEGFFSGYVPGRSERFPYRCASRRGGSPGRPTTPTAFRRFAVWAPNARRVSVVGDFNGWDGRRHPMRRRVGQRHLGAVRARPRARRALQVRDRSAPTASCCRSRPTRCRLRQPSARRRPPRGDEAPSTTGATTAGCAPGAAPGRAAPISIYEVHLGSWRRGLGNEVSHLRRAGRAAHRLRRRPGLHPRGAAPRRRAPLRRLVGLPGDRATSRPTAASAPPTTSGSSSTRSTSAASA
jgi:predicted trehalose synthase